ncbi:hypothetical protein K456DRAFT_44272, partial [Colletotrichum gloeosporioides 23]
DQIAQQSAQMIQLLTALNGLISLDRANPTPLASSVPTPSTADTTIQALTSGTTKVWYYINSRLNVNPQQVIATFYAARDPKGKQDSSKFMRYLDHTYKDPSTTSRAAAMLQTIRQQDNQSLASFLP